jgi:hypothetical protein
VAIGRRGEGRGGWERGSFWQRSITGVYGPSTAIGRLPASRKAGETKMVLGAFLRFALPGVFCTSSWPKHWIAYEHTLPDCQDCLGAAILKAKCSYRAGLPDLLLVGPCRGVHQRFVLLCCTLRPYPTPTSVASHTVAPLPKPDCQD